MDEQTTYQPVTIGNWLLTMLIMCIPLVNIIMLFVWGFGGTAFISKANWAKASLIWTLIWIVLSILIFVIFGAGAALFSTMGR
jgi:hypothetical protein